MDTTTRTIDRSVEIDAPAERVWTIISEPGWWVNDGHLTPHEIEDLGDGTCRFTDPAHGTFVITTVALDAPRHAAFRWHPTDPDDPSTLTEFWITESDGGGVVLRVVESDFDALPAEKREAFLRGNTAGWEAELLVARRAAETA